MCGIAGIVRTGKDPVQIYSLARMAGSIRHRGPDGYGFYSGPGVGLAHVRLSIVDIEGGAQPMTNESGDVLVVFNGEIYNHGALHLELSARGHHFRSRCDTEVLVHGYEQWGEDLVHRLDGQFAFAIYNRRDHSLLLARDRFGVRPLFYSERHGSLYFGSEIKALQASGDIALAPDPAGLDEVFTFWAAKAPRTPFRGVFSLEPGSLARWERGQLRTRRYYAPDYPSASREPGDAVDSLDGLMRASVSQRLMADVPVGGYLSGGLDSSITCALASRLGNAGLHTFSVAFDDAQYDESSFQREMAEQLETQHHVQQISREDIVATFPQVVLHAETPLVRTAPAPLLLLAKLTRERGIKVVLTGEGSDELFLGYDLFKETAIRRFCLRSPESSRRALLFSRIYPYLAASTRGGDWWAKSFLRASDASDPLFSHLPRFLLTSKIKEFYSAEMRAGVAGFDAVGELRGSLPSAFDGWHPLHKAAYLEMETLLASYLLSSQGDRMSMAHGVEGRYPFLDHRLFEFAARLPASSKLRVLREKEILRRWAEPLVPARIRERPKQPYMAPVVPAFFGEHAPEYVADMLSPSEIRRVGIFEPQAVEGLLTRCRSGRATGFGESQALVATLSTQLWYEQFVSAQVKYPSLPLAGADVVIRDIGNTPVPFSAVATS